LYARTVSVLTASYGEPGAEKEPIGPPPNVEVKTIQLPNGITIEHRMVLSKALE